MMDNSIKSLTTPLGFLITTLFLIFFFLFDPRHIYFFRSQSI